MIENFKNKVILPNNMELNYLATVLKEVGNFDNSCLLGRIIFQKTIYILKEIGLNFNYIFEYYHHGPYSPELATDGFTIEKEGINSYNHNLTNIELEKILFFKEIIGAKIRDPLYIEMLGTTLFLSKRERIKDNIFLELGKHQDYFRDKKEIFEDIWNKLISLKLIS